MSPDFSGSVEEALDVVLREGHVSSEVVRGATEQELRQLLPLLLCARPLDDVLVALQERVRESRTLKLRLQLLHGHPALQSISCKRRFSSVAYEEAARRLQGRRPWAGGPSENESQDKGSKEGGEDGQVSFFVDMVSCRTDCGIRNARRCFCADAFAQILTIITHSSCSTFSRAGRLAKRRLFQECSIRRNISEEGNFRSSSYLPPFRSTARRSGTRSNAGPDG